MRHAWKVIGNHQIVLVQLPDPPVSWWKRLTLWMKAILEMV